MSASGNEDDEYYSDEHNDDAEYADEEHECDYHEHQEEAERIRQEMYQQLDDDPDAFREQEAQWNEDLLEAKQKEREGREQARDEYGEDADEGHDDRIDKLRDDELVIQRRLAFLGGEGDQMEPEVGRM